MPGRDNIHQYHRVIAGAVLIIGLVLAWLSVTPTGALSCLHCFLTQRWVEGTVADRRLPQAWAESQIGWLQRAAMRDEAQATGALADKELSDMAAFEWLRQPGSEPLRPRLCRDCSQNERSSPMDPHLLGLRAPPRFLPI